MTWRASWAVDVGVAGDDDDDDAAAAAAANNGGVETDLATKVKRRVSKR
jgi:hypothetical protein